ncbi:DUF7255 family protein [Fulvivirga ulvae]|uniref:DUF7255 family protein n=1 Tax=Fulvivirga ulvae TaxID=2904245 RepID=UPI003F9007F6
MGTRENQLGEYLKQEFGMNSYSKPSHQEFTNSQFHSTIFNIYKQLGGLQPEYPTNFRGFDIQLSKLIVELDEERHFNRFRQCTLNSPVYSNYDNFKLRHYRTWCSSKEDICLQAASWGKNWENKNSKFHFGESDMLGVLGVKGSTRWKQRAFFDFLRDISSKLMKVRILRISIYHELDGISVNECIKNRNFQPIAEYVEKYV